MSAYTASKFALAGLSEALRAELQPMGVHVAQVRYRPGLGFRAYRVYRVTHLGSQTLNPKP